MWPARSVRCPIRAAGIPASANCARSASASPASTAASSPPGRLRIEQEVGARALGRRPHRLQRGAVLGLQCRADASFGQRLRPPQEWHGIERDLRSGSPKRHRCSKGARRGPKPVTSVIAWASGARDRCGVALRRRHGLPAGQNVRAPRPASCISPARITPDPMGLVRIKDVACPAAGERHRLALQQARDREPHRQLRPRRRMPTENRGAHCCEDLMRRAHHLVEPCALKPWLHPRQDDIRHRRLRRRSHGPDIAQRVDGRDPVPPARGPSAPKALR